MSESNNSLEFYKIAYDHHKEFMKQRTTCFNFYLIVLSIIFGTFFKNENLIYQVILIFLLACISFCFYIMDVRTKKLLISLEDLLVSYEIVNIPENIRLFKNEKIAKSKIKKWISLTYVYRAIYIIIPILLIITIVLDKIL